MAEWRDAHWTSKDGLKLHYRDYPAEPGAKQLPILCIPGLTGNARDFARLADRLAGKRRIIAVELRGRGDSERAKDPTSYNIPMYLDDMDALIEQAGLDRFILFGTSLGGMMAMMMMARHPNRIKGVLFNDVGPEVSSTGLNRIKGYVGKGTSSFPSWLHAARGVKEIRGHVYPDYALDDWIEVAKRNCKLTAAGRVVLDYDSAIGDQLRVPGGNAVPPDLWLTLDAFKPIPSLLVRGSLSDLMAVETADRMEATLPDLERIDVPRVGHCPTLSEPESEQAIDRLLFRVAKVN